MSARLCLLFTPAKSAFLTRYTGVYNEHKKHYPIFAHRALLAQNLGELVDLTFCEKRGGFPNVNLFILHINIYAYANSQKLQCTDFVFNQSFESLSNYVCVLNYDCYCYACLSCPGLGYVLSLTLEFNLGFNAVILQMLRIFCVRWLLIELLNVEFLHISVTLE